jgi:ubiquinone/menaquinone biosynthesis C-methylase UbiE
VSTEDRLNWVVETLDPQPADDVLELGGGNGAAAQLVLARLESGSFTGVDRSATQVVRALRRNAEAVAEGRARFLVGPLEAVDFPPASFDLVFAASVNHFWTRPAGRDLERLARLLRPGGSLWLFYEAFTPAGAEELDGKLRANAEAAALGPRVDRNGRRVALRLHA